MTRIIYSCILCEDKDGGYWKSHRKIFAQRKRNRKDSGRTFFSPSTSPKEGYHYRCEYRILRSPKRCKLAKKAPIALEKNKSFAFLVVYTHVVHMYVLIMTHLCICAHEQPFYALFVCIYVEKWRECEMNLCGRRSFPTTARISKSVRNTLGKLIPNFTRKYMESLWIMHARNYTMLMYFSFFFQLLVSGGQPTTATSPAMSGGALSPGALSPSSTATTTTGVGPAGTGGATTPVGGAATGPGCCENGRPMMTDPVTGQTVCSCQYDNAARFALGAYPRLPTATSYSSYPTPTPSTTDQGPYPSIGMDSSAFYSPLVSSLSFLT